MCTPEQEQRTVSPRRRSRANTSILDKIQDTRTSLKMEPGRLAIRAIDAKFHADDYLFQSSLPAVHTPPEFISAENFLPPVVESQDGDNEPSDDVLSYEECLRISEILGDVKRDQWALCAESEINKLQVDNFKVANLADTEDCTCLVCLQQYEENDLVKKLPCGHAFHNSCADQWLIRANACPCCRKPIDENDSVVRKS